MTGIAVAISTTGDRHRLGFLETSVAHWDRALGPGDSLFVTVDGNREDVRRAAAVVRAHTESVWQVGRPEQISVAANPVQFIRRMGVAVNKNTGLELMMDNTKAEHLFLCDDDTWPLYPQSITKHIDLDSPHSMVCWGKRRLLGTSGDFAMWHWPRGVMLYTHRSVVEYIGGMDERFGAGGHEHVEWSRRIHEAGLSPERFVSPASYATRYGMGARALWHAEDMQKMGETTGTFLGRKRHLTTIERTPEGWTNANAIMLAREGSTDYVGFRAHENGRASATLSENLMGLGAGGDA